MPRYAKPHLTFEQQLEKLVERGLSNTDRTAAMRHLKRIGYYRLSAYTYVFREIDKETSVKEGSAVRLDRFVEGATFESAVQIHDFDHELRGVLAKGLQEIEIGMRVQIGYALGKVDPWGHESGHGLCARACSQPSMNNVGKTVFEDWKNRYEKLASQAKEEDYVKHFILNYGGTYPVWVATEFMDFGSLVRLYSLLELKDRLKIARSIGIKSDHLLHSWLKALNVLRNDCAHHNRVWNRETSTQPPKPSPKMVPRDDCLHLEQVSNSRLYFLAGLVAMLTTAIYKQTNWPRQFKTVAKKAEKIEAVDAFKLMGFPEPWQNLSIWNWDGKAS